MAGYGTPNTPDAVVAMAGKRPKPYYREFGALNDVLFGK
jgi:hypothetical protein